MKNANTFHWFVGATMLILLGALTNCGSSTSVVVNDNENAKTFVAARFEEWKNGTADFFDLLADDVVWEVSGRSPVSGIYNGKNDFLTRAVKPITAKLKTRITPELISLTADENYIWLHWRGKATNLQDSSYENQYLWKLQLRGEKIVSAVAFLDTHELNELMKVQPPAEQ